MNPSAPSRATAPPLNLRAILRAIRPPQWVKNVLVFAAPGAAGELTNGSILARTLAAFVAFCLASSATYLLNDAADVESDRKHPKKRFRPIAAGLVTVQQARNAAAVIGLLAAVIGGIVSTGLLITLTGYVALTTAYSLHLKHIPIVDVLAVSFGFMLRAVAGGAATDVPLTRWFYLVVGAGALLLIVGKRLGELRSAHGSVATRPVLAKYSLTTLRSLVVVASLTAMAGYLLWVSVESSEVANQSTLIWLSAVPFVGGVIRYAGLSDKGRGESPDKLVFKDPVTLGCGILWVALFGAAVYL